MQSPRIRFTPVRLKARHDGWTAARQFKFIEVLAATKCLTRACNAVGMSRMSAYKLRDHPDAAEFRLAWSKALEPDFVAERRRSPRLAMRLRRLEKRRKVDDVHEMHGPPGFTHCRHVDFVSFGDFANVPRTVALAAGRLRLSAGRVSHAPLRPARNCTVFRCASDGRATPPPPRASL